MITIEKQPSQEEIQPPTPKAEKLAQLEIKNLIPNESQQQKKSTSPSFFKKISKSLSFRSSYSSQKHKKTSSLLNNIFKKRSSSIITTSQIKLFGTPIEEVLKRPDHKNEKLPIIVKHLTHLLLTEEKWLTYDGLFRIAVNKKILIEMELLYEDKNSDVDALKKKVKQMGPKFTCSFLKYYLNKLPYPLFTFKAWGLFCKIGKYYLKGVKRKECLEKIKNFFKKNIIDELIPVIFVLVYLLMEVDKYNKEMNIENLTRCVAPCFVRLKNPTLKDSSDQILVAKGLEFFCKNITDMDTRNENISNVIDKLGTKGILFERIFVE